MRYMGAFGSSAGLIGAALLSACSPKDGLPGPTPAIFAAPRNQSMVDSAQS